LSRKCGNLDVSTLWAFTACYRDSFTFFYLFARDFSYFTAFRSVLGATQPSFPEEIIVFNTSEIMLGRLRPLLHANEHKARPNREPLK
jgi:hypothetical protein